METGPAARTTAPAYTPPIPRVTHSVGCAEPGESRFDDPPILRRRRRGANRQQRQHCHAPRTFFMSVPPDPCVGPPSGRRSGAPRPRSTHDPGLPEAGGSMSIRPADGQSERCRCQNLSVPGGRLLQACAVIRCGRAFPPGPAGGRLPPHACAGIRRGRAVPPEAASGRPWSGPTGDDARGAVASRFGGCAAGGPHAADRRRSRRAASAGGPATMPAGRRRAPARGCVGGRGQIRSGCRGEAAWPGDGDSRQIPLLPGGGGRLAAVVPVLVIRAARDLGDQRRPGPAARRRAPRRRSRRSSGANSSRCDRLTRYSSAPFPSRAMRSSGWCIPCSSSGASAASKWTTIGYSCRPSIDRPSVLQEVVDVETLGASKVPSSSLAFGDPVETERPGLVVQVAPSHQVPGVLPVEDLVGIDAPPRLAAARQRAVTQRHRRALPNRGLQQRRDSLGDGA